MVYIKKKYDLFVPRKKLCKYIRECKRCGCVFKTNAKRSKICDGCNIRLNNHKVYIVPNIHNIMIGGNQSGV